jgi:putative endonuclease
MTLNGLNLSYQPIRVREHRYAVYIMASRSHTLYIGVTNNISRRVRGHKEHSFEGFTSSYNVERLVWYEIRGDIRVAIAREKQIKRWRREKKIRLIESPNPTWQDLSEEWGKPITGANRRSLRSG